MTHEQRTKLATKILGFRLAEPKRAGVTLSREDQARIIDLAVATAELVDDKAAQAVVTSTIDAELRECVWLDPATVTIEAFAEYANPPEEGEQEPTHGPAAPGAVDTPEQPAAPVVEVVEPPAVPQGGRRSKRKR